MMEHHLRTPEEWRAWLDALAESPERAALLDARASALVESGTEVVSAIRAAAGVEEVLERQPPLPSIGRRWPIAVTVAVALLLGFGLGRFATEPVEDVAWRGIDAEAGTVRVEQGGRLLAEVAVGRGVRPAITLDADDVVLRRAGPGRTLAWWTGAGTRIGGVTTVEGAGRLQAPPGAEALVVAVVGPDVDADVISERLGDGRHAVEPLGDVQIVAFDLVVP